jgi:Phage protein Gp138 N-terminal domain/GpV Apex motif
VFPSAGGLTLTLPIAQGDEILVVFASRCIDAWWQNGGIQIPMEMRMHDLSDGFAIPGPRSQPNTLTGISTTSAQLRTDAGTSFIELTKTGIINLVSPLGINLVGPIMMTGAVVTTGDVVADGISLSTHVHSGVTTGAGDSGPPV